MISFDCECGEPLAAAPEHAGQAVQCPRCHARLTVPQPEADFEYPADDDPPRARVRAKPAAPPPPRRGPAPPSNPTDPPARKKPVLVEDDDPPPSKMKKKAVLVDEEKPKKKKKKKASGGSDPLSGHARMYMEKANAELDEEEERHRREGGGIHFTPGIIGGTICFLIGSLLFVLFMCFFAHPLVLVPCGVLALGGIVRAVLSYMGQGVD